VTATHYRVRRSSFGALAAALISAVFAAAPVKAASVTLPETGSTLLYPLFTQWAADYTHAAPEVTITTAGTGSGAGIAAAISGEARIGASDAYMSDEQVERNRGILNIPVAISAQTVNYNIPGLDG
jgi:phosphate transport system substrate-binding protein